MLLLPPALEVHVRLTGSNIFLILRLWKMLYHLWCFQNYMYYGSTVWSNTTQKNIKKLQKVQNFAARIITCTRKYEHITPVIRQLGWLPVADMLKYYLGILTFKCLNGLAPDYLSTLFKDRSSVHDKNTRNNEKLNIPAFSSAVGQRSFEYRAVSLWNSLPAVVLCAGGPEAGDLPELRQFLLGRSRSRSLDVIFQLRLERQNKANILQK